MCVPRCLPLSLAHLQTPACQSLLPRPQLLLQQVPVRPSRQLARQQASVRGREQGCRRGVGQRLRSRSGEEGAGISVGCAYAIVKESVYGAVTLPSVG